MSTSKMYKVMVRGTNYRGCTDAEFEIPLSWDAWYEVSSYPKGDAAKRLGMRLRPELDEVDYVSVSEIY